MNQAALYGHQKQRQWVKCRAVCQLITLFAVGAMLVLSLYGGIYMPYLDAVERRTESYLHAKSFVESEVCTNQKIRQQLGRHGDADCARFQKIVESNIYKEASMDVLHKYDLCKDGNCIVLSFNLVTFVTTLLPLVLFIATLLLVLGVIYIIYSAFNSWQTSDELPFVVQLNTLDRVQMKQYQSTNKMD